LFSNVNIEKGRDSISFVAKKPFETDSGKKGNMFFYMLHRNNDYGGSKKLFYAAFLDPKKAGDITTDAYYKSGYRGNRVSESDKEEELIKDALELVKYKTRKRINRRY